MRPQDSSFLTYTTDQCAAVWSGNTSGETDFHINSAVLFLCADLNVAAAMLALFSLFLMVMGAICITMSLSKEILFFLKPAAVCFILSGESVQSVPCFQQVIGDCGAKVILNAKINKIKAYTL